MGGLKVAIVGSGRMGALLAARVPGSFRKVIISRQKAEAVALADEVGGLASDQMSALRGCKAVLITEPDETVPQVLQEMAPHLERDALVVNMAPTIMTDELAERFPAVRLAAAKVIGNARDLRDGAPGAVILDHVSGPDEALLRQLLEGLGPATLDKESKVSAANVVVMEVMRRAEAELRRRLLEIGLDGRHLEVAICSSGPGVLRTLAEPASTRLL